MQKDHVVDRKDSKADLSAILASRKSTQRWHVARIGTFATLQSMQSLPAIGICLIDCAT